MKQLFVFLMAALFATGLFAQGYEVGDVAADFHLLNVDGHYVSLSDYEDAEGIVLIFSCNHCPYVVAYEDRMIDLHNTYAPKGFPVVAVNSNDSIAEPRDSYTKMIERAEEKNFPFDYLVDADQEVYPQYGATRTPHVFLLEKEGDDFVVAYIGAIDDNYRDADAVEESFLANAIDALLAGNKPDPDYTRAIGCTIKVRDEE
ncbi:MAG: thioredoxin family protein [Bacteroidales bacterium]